MTYEEFRDICIKEYPIIADKVNAIKEMGIERVSIQIYADGHLDFDIVTRDKHFSSFHVKKAPVGEITPIEYDVVRDLERGRHLANPQWRETFSYK